MYKIAFTELIYLFSFSNYTSIGFGQKLLTYVKLFSYKDFRLKMNSLNYDLFNT